MPQTSPSVPTLEVTPTTTLPSSGSAGGPFTPTLHTFVLTNIGYTALQWSAASSANWITLSAASGSLGTNRSVAVTATIDADANALAAGTHTATITFTNVTHGIGNTTRTITLVVASASAVMTPGAGWPGATAEPGQIGTGTAKCIAHWDVVPYQVITEAATPLFSVGVVAFHIAGIQKVSFGVEGGTFVDVTSMSVNPHTGVMEYCCQLRLSDFAADGEVEIRAIAYPNAAAPQAEGTGAYAGGGYPRLLSSLKLWLDVDAAKADYPIIYIAPYGNDSTGTGTEALPVKTLYKAAQLADTAGGTDDANGAFIYCDGGDYDWIATGGGTVPVAITRWLTVMPKPGILRNQVRFTQAGWNSNPLKIRRLHLKNVTMKNFLQDENTGDRALWLDNVMMEGAGVGTQVSWHGFAWGFDGGVFITDCETRNNIHALPAQVPLKLVRNFVAKGISTGPNFPPCIINSYWEEMQDHGTSVHPDVLAWNQGGAALNWDNSIIYGLRSVDCAAIGVFFKDTGTIRNIALVNCVFDISETFSSELGQGVTSIDHLLVWNVTHASEGYWQWGATNSEIANLSIRGSFFSKMSILPGNGDFIADGRLDQVHYGNPTAFGSITPGTNVTTGDPGLDPYFRPLASSPLNGRMATLVVPIDLDGEVRTVAGSVGAYETD